MYVCVCVNVGIMYVCMYVCMSVCCIVYGMCVYVSV